MRRGVGTIGGTSSAPDGITHYVWRQPDEYAEDSVVARDGELVVFQSEDACRGAAESRDLAMEAEQPAIQDFDPVIVWLANRGDVPHDAALGLWNFAGDVARGVGVDWSDRDSDQDAVYNKLIGASLPWLTGDPSYVSDWSERDLAILRTALTSATALVRVALPAAAEDQ